MSNEQVIGQSKLDFFKSKKVDRKCFHFLSKFFIHIVSVPHNFPTPPQNVEIKLLESKFTKNKLKQLFDKI